jgi:hypothetical protein
MGKIRGTYAISGAKHKVFFALVEVSTVHHKRLFCFVFKLKITRLAGLGRGRDPDVHGSIRASLPSR